MPIVLGTVGTKTSRFFFSLFQGNVDYWTRNVGLPVNEIVKRVISMTKMHASTGDQDSHCPVYRWGIVNTFFSVQRALAHKNMTIKVRHDTSDQETIIEFKDSLYLKKKI